MSVQRVGNGGQVIVRAGVLAGVGPVGPKGPKGEQGVQGPSGVEGPTGPGGFVDESATVAFLTTSQPIASGGTAQVQWNTIEQDDEGLFTSNTTLTLTTGATYQINGFVEFAAPANAGDGIRSLQLFEDGDTDAILDWQRVPAAVVGSTVLKVAAVVKAKANAVYRIQATHTDDLSVALVSGRLTAARIGAGAPGPVGPAGPQGAVGPVGPSGAQGPAGNANTGFNTFDDL